ncbi:MAG: methyltransferase domain-containing protein [Candidatus Omnitrophica bacterium]|nr:methyltransferase domain-containing protein [Candidatus Omnitrophota bacterium]
MLDSDDLNMIVARIEAKNPLHAKKIKKHLKTQDSIFFERLTDFLGAYKAFLKKQGQGLSDALDCYLRLVAEVTLDHVRFLETGRYANQNFEEVKENVYDQPDIMDSYMKGLLLSQFFWRQHYAVFSFFIEALPSFQSMVENYLEIGCGHGLYLSQALKIFPKANIDVVDISASSLAMARLFTLSERPRYIQADIHDVQESEKYDFITLGEVLEHVQDPKKILAKVNALLKPQGLLFVTAPANAPAKDHLYLFHNEQEIKDMILKAGLNIVKDIHVYAEDVDSTRAQELKVSSLYAALAQKKG